MKNAYPYAQIIIEGKSSLEEAAAILSETLFAGITFGDKELGLFEEVPGLRLKGKFLGLLVGLHGFDGNYTLIMTPSSLTEFATPQLANISNYVAYLLREVSQWKITVRGD